MSIIFEPLAVTAIYCRTTRLMFGAMEYVETPHIDYLAKNGIIFSKFYASTPVCSPSRGSFVSGMYPQHSGVPDNDKPLSDNVITFAKVLSESGYQTGYAGKWHLDGGGKPQWEPERNFGFMDNRYMFNRGHWKKFEDTPEGPIVASLNDKGKPSYNLDGADEKTFATDYLTDKTIDFIEKNKEKPFCYMVSYPDPHGPDKVRSPYDEMYKGMAFDAPQTYNKSDDGVPTWASKAKNAGLNQSQYFGMVKCIDDNIGRLTDYLRKNDLLSNTIIVFTSDHGDLRGEHHRHNKGVPLEASAKVPFIIYYPTKIQAGSVVKNAYNTVDFSPTILGFMNQKIPAQMQGTNFSELVLNPSNQEEWQDITFIRSTGRGNNGHWIAAISSQYKLILSNSDEPWLIDMKKDPNELINYFSETDNKDIVQKLAQSLKDYGEKYNDPYLKETKIVEDLKKGLSF